MTDLIEDLSTLTGVSEKVLRKFIPVSNYCIGHAVHESCCRKTDLTMIDIGIGELHVKCDFEGIRYKFIPSKELEGILSKTIITGTSPVISKLDNNIQEKIERAYKELL